MDNDTKTVEKRDKFYISLTTRQARVKFESTPHLFS